MEYLLFAALYGSLSLWIIGFVSFFRKKITCMVGMMAAMALGMIVGLGMGTLLAVWLPGQFFQATMLGILVGGMVGAVAGMPISLMAVLDGLLSGIMGGMMGTMLLVMIPAPYVQPTLKILSVLSSSVIFMLFLMLLGEVKTGALNKNSFIWTKPSSMFTVIAILMLAIMQVQTAEGSQMQHQMSPSNPILESQELHSQRADQETSQSSLIVDKEIIIQASEFAFTPSAISLEAGKNTRITLKNSGSVEHDFEIIGTDIHIHAASKKSISSIVNLSKAGTYQVVCTLPGHKEAGMVAMIHVIP